MTASDQPLSTPRVSRWSERKRLVPVLLTGLYVWSVVHFPLARPVGLDAPVGWCALAALLLLAVAPWTPSKRGSLYCVLHGFLSVTALEFWWAGEDAWQRVHPGYTPLAWLSYTVALGALSTPERTQFAGHDEAQLLPRSRASVVAPILQVLVGAVVFGLVVLSLDIERAELRVLAHVVTLALGLLMLETTVRLGQWFQHRELVSPRRNLLGSWWIMVMLAALGIISWVTGWGLR